MNREIQEKMTMKKEEDVKKGLLSKIKGVGKNSWSAKTCMLLWALAVIVGVSAGSILAHYFG